LERIIGNRNNEIKELNIDLKDKERQITALSSKLKDKDRDALYCQYHWIIHF
jgi:predicted RNase H-like nuclease (RuvC/YqgF family)